MGAGSQSNNGNLSFRTTTYANARLLTQAKNKLVLSKWASQQDMPRNKGTNMSFRRYNHFNDGIHPIINNETPSISKIDYYDFSVDLKQYGKVVHIPEAMVDTHEDPVVMAIMDELGYDLARTVEKIDFGVVSLCSQALFANGTQTSDVNTTVTEDDIINAIAQLEDNDAMEISELVTSTPNFGTANIPNSFIGYCHSNLASVVRAMPSFIPFQKYTNQKPMMGEIGTVAEKLRVVCSNIHDFRQGCLRYHEARWQKRH